MFRIISLIAIVGALYLMYNAYGYRYYLDNIKTEAPQAMRMGANNDANITIVAYLDYDSATSRRVYPILLRLLSIDSKVSVILRPVETDSKNSALALRVALAAKKQGRFMDVNNVFLSNNVELKEDYIESAIRSLGLNYERVKSDALSPDIEVEIGKLNTEAKFLGITSYPHIFIEHVKMPGANFTINEITGIIEDLRKGRR